MIRPNMATMLGFVATDAVIAPALLQALVARGRRPSLQPHHHRRRHLDQRLLHPDRHAPGRACRDHRARQRRRRGAARRGDRGGAATGPGHRARRRGRHQVHHGAGRRRPRRRPNAGWWPTPSRTRRWSRRRSSPATPTWAASWPRSAMPASTTSTRR